ncbi:LolA family protein [Natronincola ferrireducens]|uniref:Outer membrane lipoprotein-sorting protein n=1 Tax=Natronincola ferrireducens TaxID=393762 RepID=A0A1G9G5V9_9FIRM|nr:outer-membrane lipoprotein carrier protein LolA [Natronincola ferrireducens]SDK96005.1 Outer membrane lipoprotein-sorting protein [Natronincola ferrireducens]
MKYWRVVIILGLALMLVACQQPTNEEAYYKIQKKLADMESYQCKAKIYINQEGQEVEYTFLQSFKKPNQYRLEGLAPEGIRGNLTIYNGKTAWLWNPSINQIWKIDNFHQSQEQMMFIGYFLRNYVSSKEASFRAEGLQDKDYIILSTEIPGGNHYFAQQKLWVDKKEMIPLKLYIYDIKGNTRYRVYYEDFFYNFKLEDELFYLQQQEY